MKISGLCISVSPVIPSVHAGLGHSGPSWGQRREAEAKAKKLAPIRERCIDTAKDRPCR